MAAEGQAGFLTHCHHVSCSLTPFRYFLIKKVILKELTERKVLNASSQLEN